MRPVCEKKKEEEEERDKQCSTGEHLRFAGLSVTETQSEGKCPAIAISTEGQEAHRRCQGGERSGDKLLNYVTVGLICLLVIHQSMRSTDSHLC
ncbi:hypothetical protein AAFF_G00226030 [Aldrovandia affinis]|uniref:Uncharacterized protein n=1 Tax=Aldrovandia affinis TaxID=143900 RepID=A0AAD7TBB1_9TELE|nr:hypothetical protein AAFF_G00226030 [Aldrovandia affinis]